MRDPSRCATKDEKEGEGVLVWVGQSVVARDDARRSRRYRRAEPRHVSGGFCLSVKSTELAVAWDSSLKLGCLVHDLIVSPPQASATMSKRRPSR